MAAVYTVIDSLIIGKISLLFTTSYSKTHSKNFSGTQKILKGDFTINCSPRCDSRYMYCIALLNVEIFPSNMPPIALVST